MEFLPEGDSFIQSANFSIFLASGQENLKFFQACQAYRIEKYPYTKKIYLEIKESLT
jgi:hypothetical protein